MNTKSTDTIETIRHSLYSRAERSWWVALVWVVTGLATTLFLVHPSASTTKVFESICLGVSALASVMAALCRRWASTCAARADLCRRAFLYGNTLGKDLSLEEQRIIALWPADTALNSVTTARPYFSSSECQGPDRLADAVGESAFFTAELARLMANGGFILASACALAFATTVISTTTMVLEATALNNLHVLLGMAGIAIFILLIAEVFFTSLAYKTLHSEAMSVFRSAEQFRQLAEQNEITAVRLAESYSIALAANLPIPNGLYKWQHDRIDRAYRLSRGESAN